MLKRIITIILAISVVYPQVNVDKFKQLSEDITTPNTYRTAAGYPGHDYWQQEADYVMDLTIDDEKQILYGDETITFHNNSPDQLNYLWVQLDQNVRALDSDSYKIQSSGDFGAQRGREKVMVGESIPLGTLKNFYRDFFWQKRGVMRESNSRPLAPKARIIPLDQSPKSCEGSTGT